MGQESRHGLAWFSVSGCYLEAAIQVLVGPAVHFRSWLGERVRVWAHVVVGHSFVQSVELRHQFLAGCQPKATSNSLQHGLLHQAAPNIAGCFFASRNGDSLQQDGHYSLCSSHAHIITCMPSSLLCLLVRSKSELHPNWRGDDYTRLDSRDIQNCTGK